MYGETAATTGTLLSVFLKKKIRIFSPILKNSKKHLQIFRLISKNLVYVSGVQGKMSLSGAKFGPYCGQLRVKLNIPEFIKTIIQQFENDTGWTKKNATLGIGWGYHSKKYAATLILIR